MWISIIKETCGSHAGHESGYLEIRYSIALVLLTVRTVKSDLSKLKETEASGTEPGNARGQIITRVLYMLILGDDDLSGAVVDVRTDEPPRVGAR